MLRIRAEISDCLWPHDSLAPLTEAVARHAGLQTRTLRSFHGAADIESICTVSGLEAEPIDLRARELERLLREAPPAILPLEGEGYLAIVGSRRREIRLLDPRLRVRTIALDDLTASLCRVIQSPHEAEIDHMLAMCHIPASQRRRARGALLLDRVSHMRVGRLWHVRVPPGSDFVRQVHQSGLLSRLVLFAGAHAIEFALWLVGWWLLGQAALSGRPDRGWLIAWALLLVTMAPMHMAMVWMQGRLAIGLGGLLRQRLLAGALRLQQDVIRHQGSGGLLGRVIESETVESLGLSGGMAALSAVIEIVLASLVLMAGAAGRVHVALLAIWLAATIAAAWIYGRRQRAWTESRLRMTDDIVEQMAGHRTRLAQEDPSLWHRDEDPALETYLHQSKAMDSWRAALMTFIPRGWLIAGLAALAPTFVEAVGASATPLAIGLGGVMLAHRALKKVCVSASQLSAAVIAWQNVKPLFEAAADVETMSTVCGESTATTPALEIEDVTFTYAEHPEPVLRGVSLRVARGDRVLLEGESGGGKSTLAAVLTGLRAAGSGMLMAGGLDLPTLGTAGWRKRVAAAPQYHENHVLSAPFAFNLLMGRQWPPREEDLREAEQVCRELGLGPLLTRMQGGLHQMVGETGWQLSQGERSRLFIARALLQDAELVILDESFAALDPVNLRQALECVLNRARTLMVVAHP